MVSVEKNTDANLYPICLLNEMERLPRYILNLNESRQSSLLEMGADGFSEKKSGLLLVALS